jgi:hypothetical protein
LERCCRARFNYAIAHEEPGPSIASRAYKAAKSDRVLQLHEHGALHGGHGALHDGGVGGGVRARWWRVGALGRVENTKVDEPGAWICISMISQFAVARCVSVCVKLTGVELGVDGLNEPLLGRLGGCVLDDLEDDDAGDFLGLLAGALGAPADGDLSSRSV